VTRVPDANKKRLVTWRKLQKKEWQRYRQKGPKGVFSHAGHKIAVAFGKFVAARVSRGQRLLDVGCGCLELPAYLAPAHWSGVEIVGLDPFDGDRDRLFEFRQGMAEDLPFGDGEFDAVVMASTVDHFVAPKRAMQEAARVLKPGGLLLVWYARRWGPKYRRWLENPLSLYNTMHQWAFSDAAMKALVESGDTFDVEIVDKRGPKNRFLMARRKS